MPKGSKDPRLAGAPWPSLYMERRPFYMLPTLLVPSPPGRYMLWSRNHIQEPRRDGRGSGFGAQLLLKAKASIPDGRGTAGRSTRYALPRYGQTRVAGVAANVSTKTPIAVMRSVASMAHAGRGESPWL